MFPFVFRDFFFCILCFSSSNRPLVRVRDPNALNLTNNFMVEVKIHFFKATLAFRFWESMRSRKRLHSAALLIFAEICWLVEL